MNHIIKQNNFNMAQQTPTLLTQFEMLASISNLCDKQHQYYAWIANNAQLVNVTSIQCLADSYPHFVAWLLDVDFRKHECYSNAWQVCSHAYNKYHNLRVEYVEGQLDMYGIGIDHAFNKVVDWSTGTTQEFYIDVTSELVLAKDAQELESQQCLVFKSFDCRETAKLLLKTRTCGYVFQQWFRDNIANINTTL